MTDLEICKRMAEIKGLIISNHSIDIDDLWVHTRKYKDSSVTFFNPLSDDALCFQLMVEFNVDVQHYTDKGYTECTMWEYQGNFFVDEISRVSDKSTNKAICLAIIEAHNQ